MQRIEAGSLTNNISTQKSNPLCRKCLRACKQPEALTLIDCPRFFPLPFKIDRHRFEQLGLFPDESH